MENVKSTQPFAAWRGGKRVLAKRIVARINAIEHHCYAEPFVGMGGYSCAARPARAPR